MECIGGIIRSIYSTSKERVCLVRRGVWVTAGCSLTMEFRLLERRFLGGIATATVRSPIYRRGGEVKHHIWGTGGCIFAVLRRLYKYYCTDNAALAWYLFCHQNSVCGAASLVSMAVFAVGHYRNRTVCFRKVSISHPPSQVLLSLHQSSRSPFYTSSLDHR